MKQVFVSFVCIVLFSISSKAQMDAVMERYFKCMSDCRDGKGGLSDADIAQCKQVCFNQTNCPKTSAKALAGVVSLVPSITTKPGTSSFQPIYQDKVYQYFAVYKEGKLQGYQLKNKAGVSMPFPLVSYMVNGKKQYYIFDITGKYLEVKAPDIAGVDIKGKTL